MAPAGTKAEPRDRLLDAAEAQFRRFGYRRTTVDEITSEAGTGKGSLYLHFHSKESIYLAVVEASVERFIEKATTALRGHGSVPDRLSTLVEVTAEHYGDDEFLRASLVGEERLVDSRVAALAAEVQRSRIRGLLAEILEEGHRVGSVRTDLDPDTTAAVLFEMGWGVVRAGLGNTTGLPLEDALAVLNEIVGRGIRLPDRT